MEYLFGDDDIAARRLEELARVFAPPTRAFLLDTVVEAPETAVDLGCGPGLTTHLLADLLKCGRTVGLDNSEHFLSLAKKTETDKVSFRRQDVTSVPFPSDPAEIIFCRLLLTHLEDPGALVASWSTQLKPGGLLLIEEVEWIRTGTELFDQYIKIVEALLAHQSNNLYLGPVLDSLQDTGALKKSASGVFRYPVKNSDAAAMFHLNIQAWKEYPYIRTTYSSELIDRVERELSLVKDGRGGEMDIEWGLRQIVFQRT